MPPDMRTFPEPHAVDQDLPLGWMSVTMGAGVHALMSARAGGVSRPPYDQCNLGDHVQDDPDAVARNRRVLAARMHAEPLWLTQVHGNRVVRFSREAAPHDPDRFCVMDLPAQPEADGAFTTEPGLACTVMVADCLPVLLAAPEGRGVAALHAGWRGLAGAGTLQGQGIVHTGVRALCEATGCDPSALRVWLGPCIGPAQFEVGPDVLQGFGVDPVAGVSHHRFVARHLPAMATGEMAAPRWLADLPGLAQDTLRTLGVVDISGGRWCTVTDGSRFFSFRRDRVTGRQAASICLR